MSKFEKELPFAIIEEYMLRDDDSSYPMDSIRMVHLTGKLLMDHFREALQTIYARHPLLTMQAEDRGNLFFWVPAEEEPEIVCRNADTDSEALNASGFPSMRPLDLFSGPGFRIYVVESPSRNWTKILFQFHHSVSDGLGEMQIIGEILTLYAKSQGAVPADTELVPVDVSKLPLRRKIGWPLGSYLRNFFHSKISAWQLAVGEPIPLFDHQPAKRGDECGIYPFLQSFDLTQEETKAYLKKAKSLNVTVNDLMLFHLFTAMEEWRALSGKSIPKGKSRLMVPTNLRQPHHEGMPAANIVSAIFLDRTAKQVNGDPEKLLKGIHREMEWAKKHDQKYIFTVALRVLMTVPGLLKYTLKYPKCRSTGVLSNLGRIWEKSPIPRNAEGKIQIGENVVEFIDAAPPIRSRTMFAYSAMTYAGALRLCMRYDHRFISTSEAENFLEIFKKKLTEN